MPFVLNYFLINFIVFFLVFISLDFLIFLLIKKNIKWVKIIIIGVVYLSILLILFIVYTKKTSPYDIFNYIGSELTQSLNIVLNKEITKGLTEKEAENIRAVFDIFIIKMVPTYIIIFLFIITFLNYLIVRLFMISKFKIINKLPPFTQWYLDERIIWILIIALIFLILKLKNFLDNEIIYLGAINVIFFLANLYFLIGLSLTIFFLEKYRVHFFLQIILILFIFLWNKLSFMIMFTGILDTWFNLRKISKGGLS